MVRYSKKIRRRKRFKTRRRNRRFKKRFNRKVSKGFLYKTLRNRSELKSLTFTSGNVLELPDASE